MAASLFSSTTHILLPSKAISASAEKAERVRMALLVLMFDVLAMSIMVIGICSYPFFFVKYVSSTRIRIFGETASPFLRVLCRDAEKTMLKNIF